MIPGIKVLDDEVGIPIYGTNEYCWIEWKENECKDIALGRAYEGDFKRAMLYSRFKVAPRDFDVEDPGHYEGCEIITYEVKCRKSEIKYLMVSYNEVEEFDDIYHCVCLPFNRLNLYKFYSEYLCLLGMVKYRG